MTTTTITSWKQAHEFESALGKNIIQLDGSQHNGYGPKALLLAGLAACSGIDVVDILQKMKVEFSDFTIVLEAEQVEEHPKVYKDISLTYRIKMDASNETKFRKAIDLSLEKYCGVAAMLKKNSDIHYKVEIQ